MKCDEYTACVKRDFLFRDGEIERKYIKGQVLEGKLEQIGKDRMFVCDGYFFGLDRFEKLTAVVKDSGMTVKELAGVMNLPSGRRELFGMS